MIFRSYRRSGFFLQRGIIAHTLLKYKEKIAINVMTFTVNADIMTMRHNMAASGHFHNAGALK